MPYRITQFMNTYGIDKLTKREGLTNLPSKSSCSSGSPLQFLEHGTFASSHQLLLVPFLLSFPFHFSFTGSVCVCLHMCLHVPMPMACRGQRRLLAVLYARCLVPWVSPSLHLELTFQGGWWPKHHPRDPFVLVPPLTLYPPLQFLRGCI